MSDRVTPLAFRRLSATAAADIRDLQAVLSAAPAYSLLVEGKLPGSSAAQELLAAFPPGKSDLDKFVLGIYSASGVIGCVDVIRGYPTREVAFIGLLLFTEHEQGKSHGVHALRHVEAMARGWGCSALHIAVVETNTRATAFWQREGFAELYRKPSSRFTGQVIVMKRSLTDAFGAPPSTGIRP